MYTNATMVLILDGNYEIHAHVRSNPCKYHGGHDCCSKVFCTLSIMVFSLRVICPALFVYVCPICNNTGHQAHTIKHCPYNPEVSFHPLENCRIIRK